MDERPATEPLDSEKERWELLRGLEVWLEAPMVVLGIVWLALFLVELVWGLSPFLQTSVTVIWILFILDFLFKLVLAPRKVAFLKSSWLTAVSLMLPALRILRLTRAFRLLPAARSARGLRFLRMVTSMNRGLRSLATTMSRRGLGYVLLLTLVIAIAGAAGMFSFERGVAGAGMDTYGDAVWWTLMLMTSVGPQYWPQTPEGRILCLLLAIYGLAVLGYFTAALASFFIGQDAEAEEGEVASERSLSALRDEIVALRREVADLHRR